MSIMWQTFKLSPIKLPEIDTETVYLLFILRERENSLTVLSETESGGER